MSGKTVLQLHDFEPMDHRQSHIMIFINKDYTVKHFTANTSERIKRIFGKDIKAGDSLPDLLGSEEKLRLMELIDQAFLGNTLKEVMQCHGINNEDCWFELYLSPLYEGTGEASAVCISVWSADRMKRDDAKMRQRDLSKQKYIEQKLIEKNIQLTKALKKLERAKERLMYNEKLACIGQLAAGVAHEINNPLGFICSNIESTRRYYDDFKEVLFAYRDFAMQVPNLPAESIRAETQRLAELESKIDIDFLVKDQDEMFSDIEDGLKRISEIIMGLRAFSRQGQGNEFEDYDLNKGIQNSLIIAKNDIKYHAGVRTNLGDIPLIQAMSSRIDQVLLNIILNASCAIKDKKTGELGLITITTDVKDGFVRCRIEDNGVGIDPENIDKIFDPFFTTKAPGQGTGMGLSIAYDIVVNQHGGQLFAESTPMVGSVFTILLPVDQNASKQVTDNE